MAAATFLSHLSIGDSRIRFGSGPDTLWPGSCRISMWSIEMHAGRRVRRLATGKVAAPD